MAEITSEELKKKNYKTMSKTEFAKSVGNVTSQALDYVLEQDKIDYIMVGSHRVIVLTEKTKLYTPSKNKNRAIMRT